ncbi:NYN domain-containing protein [Pseudanabaena sp. FACHB-1998]|nr:NYN domain-containing protein [Pseudanabaena sp. FACHB-1998]
MSMLLIENDSLVDTALYNMYKEVLKDIGYDLEIISAITRYEGHTKAFPDYQGSFCDYIIDELLEKRKNCYDLISVDIDLGDGGNGYDILKWAHENHACKGAIIFTSTAFTRDPKKKMEDHSALERHVQENFPTRERRLVSYKTPDIGDSIKKLKEKLLKYEPDFNRCKIQSLFFESLLPRVAVYIDANNIEISSEKGTKGDLNEIDFFIDYQKLANHFKRDTATCDLFFYYSVNRKESRINAGTPSLEDITGFGYWVFHTEARTVANLDQLIAIHVVSPENYGKYDIVILVTGDRSFRLTIEELNRLNFKGKIMAYGILNKQHGLRDAVETDNFTSLEALKAEIQVDQ